MAKPSLEIGNDKWAIKEDSLLGYGISDGVFVPQPITMTRASAATRVNSEGLVETVGSLGSELVDNGSFSQIGNEEVTNGDFSEIGSETTPASDFSSSDLETNPTTGSVSEDNGTLTFDNSSSSGVQVQLKNRDISSDKTYKISFTLSDFTSGTFRISVGNNITTAISYNDVGAEGTHTFYVTKTGGQNRNYFYTSSTSVVVSNISVKEIGQDWTFAGLATMGDEVVSFVDNGTNTNSSIAQSVLTTSKSYKLVFEITRYVAGRIQILSGGGTYRVDISGGIGVYTIPIQSVGSTTFTIKRDGGYPNFDFDIDNVSVKELDPDDDWVLGTGWSIGDDKATCSSGNASLTQDVSPEIGKQYKVTVNITEYTSGILYIDLGGSSAQTFTSTGNKTFYLTTISTGLLRFYGGAFRGSIDNISVKEATINNLARVDYTDGTSSLLAEPERTNLITQSELFSDSSWNKVGSITTTDNYTTSPSGQNNATRLQWTNATNYIYQAVSHVGSDFTVSIYLKSNTGVSQDVRLFMDNGAQGQDVVVTTQWQRFEFTNTTTPTQSNRNTGLIKSGAQVGDLDISIWGAQFEEGSYAASYIPTYGTTVTRVQDQYKKTGISDLINSEEGSFFIDMAALNELPDPQLSISLSGDSSADRLLVFCGSGGGEWNVQFRKDSSTIVNVKKSITITNQSKVAVSWKSGKYIMYIDGDKATNYTQGSETHSVTFDAGDLKHLQFSPNNNSTSNLFHGKVKQLQVYTTALTDSELETLTT
jgi:hypothetical protein